MLFLKRKNPKQGLRGFVEKDVPEQIIEELLYKAIELPSGGNCYPWHFFIIRDKSIIEQIYEKACKELFLITAPVLLIACKNTRPFSGYINDPEHSHNTFSSRDTEYVIENILFCATALNLCSYWCGEFNEEALKEVGN